MAPTVPLVGLQELRDRQCVSSGEALNIRNVAADEQPSPRNSPSSYRRFVSMMSPRSGSFLSPRSTPYLVMGDSGEAASTRTGSNVSEQVCISSPTKPRSAGHSSPMKQRARVPRLSLGSITQQVDLVPGGGANCPPPTPPPTHLKALTPPRKAWGDKAMSDGSEAPSNPAACSTRDIPRLAVERLPSRVSKCSPPVYGVNHRYHQDQPVQTVRMHHDGRGTEERYRIDTLATPRRVKMRNGECWGVPPPSARYGSTRSRGVRVGNITDRYRVGDEVVEDQWDVLGRLSYAARLHSAKSIIGEIRRTSAASTVPVS
eukprot:CAMPEP_0177780540 /NCGR_PEP_ID=MMETSP0491_2-20121128/17266_1 /TAXON_ID=63592 /ORGANISM="Tetraselmis chuii, Strain PLY429" /LENGTH=315 /DNA_ID=CAMNT_0019300335 /DNA_START=109 /DNA_END=1056 /DNA_ORIENTATION=-